MTGGSRRAEDLIEEAEVRQTLLLGFREGRIQGSAGSGIPRVWKWLKQRSRRFVIVVGFALGSRVLRPLQELLILRRGTGRERRLPEEVVQMFPGLGLKCSPSPSGDGPAPRGCAPRPKKRKHGSGKPAPRLSPGPRVDKYRGARAPGRLHPFHTAGFVRSRPGTGQLPLPAQRNALSEAQLRWG